MGSGTSRRAIRHVEREDEAVTNIAYANAREIEQSEDGSSVIDDRKSMSDGNSAFNDLTVDESFDDASTGTDYRVIQILSLSQNEKNQQLLDAAAAGHESECALLLKYGASTQRLDWHTQTTPFQLAKDGKDRWSPLHAAARNGHRKICLMLLKAGAPLDRQNGWLRSPLHYAAEHGHRNVVAALLHHGAAIDLTDWHGWSPLHFACGRGHRACVELLLDAGADPNARTLSQQTPLHLAAKVGRDDTLRLLLDFGAKPNARARGSTPLHEATKACNESCVSVLLGYGADPKVSDANRKTPVMYAVLHKDRLSEAHLIGAGAYAAHLDSAKKFPEKGPSSISVGGGTIVKSGGPSKLNVFKRASAQVIQSL